MQIEKALLNDRLRVWEVSWKFYILTIYNFTVIYRWNLLFSLKVAYFLTVSVVFSVCELNNLKTRTAMNAKVSVFVISVEGSSVFDYIICMTEPEPIFSSAVSSFLFQSIHLLINLPG